MLNREQALSKWEYEKTMKLLQKFFNGEYDPNRFIHRSQDKQREIAATKIQKEEINVGILELFIRNLFKLFRL